VADNEVNEVRTGVRPERGKSWDSVEIDEDALPLYPNHLRGLMDAESVSAFLGYPRPTIRSWGARKKGGTGKGGAPAKFPDPVDGKLGNVVFWDADDIIAFRQRRVADAKMKKKQDS